MYAARPKQPARVDPSEDNYAVDKAKRKAPTAATPQLATIAQKVGALLMAGSSLVMLTGADFGSLF